MQKIIRNYLEIKSLNNLSEITKPNKNVEIIYLKKFDFQLNKFLYKEVGKKYHWKDRFNWPDQDWIKHVSNPLLFVYILKVEKEIAGFFELIYHKEKSQVEIAYLGLLEEYFGKKLGGYLLSQAIKKSWALNVNRVYVHTCSLDHKNALNNYLARGMTIFNSEVVKIN